MKNPLFFLMLLVVAGSFGGEAWTAEPPENPALELVDGFMGISYRDDGALDTDGRYTLFEHQDRFFSTPGLNCSGFVLAVGRQLLGRNIDLDQARHDRRGDSGPGSPLGLNWDFGWDLIFNMSEGLSRRVIMPDGLSPTLEGANGQSLRGFDLEDQAEWASVLPQIKPGPIYLASISRALGRDSGAKVLHYHVALILADGHGGIWMYQTTHTRGPSRLNLNSTQGLEAFIQAFGPRGIKTKKILILEVEPVKETRPTSVPENPRGWPGSRKWKISP